MVVVVVIAVRQLTPLLMTTTRQRSCDHSSTAFDLKRRFVLSGGRDGGDVLYMYTAVCYWSVVATSQAVMDDYN